MSTQKKFTLLLSLILVYIVTVHIYFIYIFKC